MPATPQQILDRLRAVAYPGFSRDIVSFGLVRDIEVSSDGVTVHLAPSTANEDVVRQIVAAVEATLAGVAGPVRIVREVAPVPPGRRGPQPVPGVATVVAVASGKGGVGKSTVATNLALALSAMGHRVGLMDADVYGPSVPLLLGIEEKARGGDGRRLVPIERHGIRVMSMGFFLDEVTPVVWRGPMLTKLVTEFLRNCEWGELDVLVLDLPPGTGDIQLTLTQQLPMQGGVVVTTPQDVALADVRRGIQMFRQCGTPVLGVVENMSFHLCPGCGARADIFGHGGGATMARELGVPFLGEIPLARSVREAGDAGVPLVAAEPASPLARAFHELAERVLVRLAEGKREPVSAAS
ncbi:MAG: Mrp/NBP35 family ATP-binding protein [bacterium]|nr:Mrp/NBP35 family ATP-binding protein [bacterium]